MNPDLRALGADAIAHVAGSLAAHLERTEGWLRRFGAREALCRAGLWHAVYGIDADESDLTDEEAAIAAHFEATHIRRHDIWI